MEALRHVEQWPAAFAAAALVRRDGGATHGDTSRRVGWASVTKPVVAYACLIAIEEGTLELDEPAGPPGSTVRHLLAHASGLPPAGPKPVSLPGKRRIYSNTGFEVLAGTLAERAELPFVDYLEAAVLRPLGMDARLVGSPASGLEGSLDDLVRFARELLEPTLLATQTLAEATTVAFPGLGGVLPGFGRLEPNDWGLGFDLRDGKEPYWMGRSNSPGTFGHFGGSGTFVWVDRRVDAALACLTDREFGEWAKTAWPALSDSVLAELGG